MKYFEKLAFDPKSLIGPAIGATSFGLSGYAASEKGKEWPSAVGAAIVGGVVGKGVQSYVKTLKKGMGRKGFFGGLFEDKTYEDFVVERSQKLMRELDIQKDKIKYHRPVKSTFKYKDALKMTKEKKAAFLDDTIKLAKASKSEATIYTGVAGATGAYGGLRAGEAFAKAHTKAIAELIPKNKYNIKMPPFEHAANISKKVKRFGAIAGGALGAGAAANYFIRKNI